MPCRDIAMPPFADYSNDRDTAFSKRLKIMDRLADKAGRLPKRRPTYISIHIKRVFGGTVRDPCWQQAPTDGEKRKSYNENAQTDRCKIEHRVGSADDLLAHPRDKEIRRSADEGD